MFTTAILAVLSLALTEAPTDAWPWNKIVVEADGDAITFTAGEFEGRARKLRFRHSEDLLILEGTAQSSR